MPSSPLIFLLFFLRAIRFHCWCFDITLSSRIIFFIFFFFFIFIFFIYFRRLFPSLSSFHMRISSLRLCSDMLSMFSLVSADIADDIRRLFAIFIIFFLHSCVVCACACAMIFHAFRYFRHAPFRYAMPRAAWARRHAARCQVISIYIWLIREQIYSFFFYYIYIGPLFSYMFFIRAITELSFYRHYCRFFFFSLLFAIYAITQSWWLLFISFRAEWYITLSRLFLFAFRLLRFLSLLSLFFLLSLFMPLMIFFIFFFYYCWLRFFDTLLILLFAFFFRCFLFFHCYIFIFTLYCFRLLLYFHWLIWDIIFISMLLSSSDLFAEGFRHFLHWWWITSFSLSPLSYAAFFAFHFRFHCRCCFSMDTPYFIIAAFLHCFHAIADFIRAYFSAADIDWLRFIFILLERSHFLIIFFFAALFELFSFWATYITLSIYIYIYFIFIYYAITVIYYTEPRVRRETLMIIILRIFSLHMSFHYIAGAEKERDIY